MENPLPSIISPPATAHFMASKEVFGDTERSLFRFLLFPQHEHTVALNVSTSVARVKVLLVKAFASRRPDLCHASQLRLIRCGAELLDHDTLEQSVRDFKRSNADAQLSAVTIHVVARSHGAVRGESTANTVSTTSQAVESGEIDPGSSPHRGLSQRRMMGNEIGAAIERNIARSRDALEHAEDQHASGATQEGGNNQSMPSGSDSEFLSGFSDEDAQAYFAQWEESVHFHGAFFDEEESLMVEQAFQKHAGVGENVPEDRIHFKNLHRFMWMYFQWTTRNGLRPSDAAWPTAHFKRLCRRVLDAPLGTQLKETTVTLQQFREVFFLFDNTGETDCCPHGARDRVMAATLHLHNQLMGEDVPFDSEGFGRIFAHCQRPGEDELTCQNVELLYFLYCVSITKQHAASQLARMERNAPRHEIGMASVSRVAQKAQSERD